MKITSVVALLPALAAAIPSSTKGWNAHSSPKAAYFLRVDPAGSSVVAVQVGSNGMLTDTTATFSTGGVGLQTQNYTNGLKPTAIDPLQSQNSVTIGDRYLFTVNSGSDTLVMFEIDHKDPLKLKMVGKPVATYGQFPVSVAYSTKHKKACVLNGGAVNGVSCYSVSRKNGLVPDGVGLRNFGYNATTPGQLNGYSGSGSDIQFATNSSKLVSTFKGAGTTGLGHIDVFDVDSSGDISKNYTDNQIAPLGGVFGFSWSGSEPGNMFVSDVAFAGSLLSLDFTTNKFTELATSNSSKFVASCWTVWSPTTDLYYNINAGSPYIGEITAAGKLENIMSFNATLAGATDTAVNGATAYMLTFLNVINVMDLQSGKNLQMYDYGTAEDRQYWTGMALYPASPLLVGGM